MRPQFVYFDLGNVLLYFDHDLAFRKIAKVAKTTPAHVREVVMDTGLQIEYETGHLSGAEFVGRIGRTLQTELDVGEVLEAAADMFIANVHILPVLARVKTMGIPMGLLSNTCEAHWQWILEQRYSQVIDWFSPIILSYEARSMKPDSLIYEVAEEQCRTDPKGIFFTDDRADNIAAASARGWQTEQFVNADRLMKIIDTW